jgi:hypothetical protein
MADYVSSFPISRIYKFPVYQTREQFRAANNTDAPPYNPGRPRKFWYDPTPSPVPAGGSKKILYTTLLLGANERVLAGPDGKPGTDMILLDSVLARTVNIPASGPGILDAPQFEPATPVPIRELAANEELIFTGMFGLAEVHLTDVAPASDPGAFTSEDRALLHAIASKVGL